jgi:high-affinity iron transporter
VTLRIVLLVAAVAVFRELSPGGAARGESAQPAPQSPERGRGLYARHCASCHGPTGQGDGEAGRDLDPQPSNLRDPEIAARPAAKLFRQITRGRRPMPSFGRLLSDEDRWTLAAFVKTLGPSDGGRNAR